MPARSSRGGTEGARRERSGGSLCGTWLTPRNRHRCFGTGRTVPTAREVREVGSRIPGGRPAETDASACDARMPAAASAEPAAPRDCWAAGISSPSYRWHSFLRLPFVRRRLPEPSPRDTSNSILDRHDRYGPVSPVACGTGRREDRVVVSLIATFHTHAQESLRDENSFHAREEHRSREGSA